MARNSSESKIRRAYAVPKFGADSSPAKALLARDSKEVRMRKRTLAGPCGAKAELIY